jgi:hypothetical protein
LYQGWPSCFHFSIGIAKVLVFCLGLEARIARIAEELEADQAETYEMPLEVLCGFAETPLRVGDRRPARFSN